MLAAIVALEALKESCRVTIHTDSEYLANAVEKGWARRWKANGWRRNKKEKALNPDLWERLITLCDGHEVEFKWIRGHAGDIDNERCDSLAIQAARQSTLIVDEGYEASKTDNGLT